jgi:hypothetical protein
MLAFGRPERIRGFVSWINVRLTFRRFDRVVVEFLPGSARFSANLYGRGGRGFGRSGGHVFSE